MGGSYDLIIKVHEKQAKGRYIMKELINYIEYPSKDLSATKAFFEAAFGWSFTDYGPEYTAFEGQGVDGGFYLADKACRADQGGALTVFLSQDLATSEANVVAAGGVISTPAFSFPGGRRFHFFEPSGNEFAVWVHE